MKRLVQTSDFEESKELPPINDFNDNVSPKKKRYRQILNQCPVFDSRFVMIKLLTNYGWQLSGTQAGANSISGLKSPHQS